MKGLFKIICGLSIVGLATVACNKEIETEVITELPAVTKHSVKVKAGISADTKTVMLSSGDQTKWTSGDVDNMHFFENGIAPDPSDLAVSLMSDETELTIMAEFANTSADKFVYTSILASDLDADKNATLADAQVILDGTFDPDADILVANPEEFDATQSMKEFTMQYKRVVAVNKIKIKGMTEGDKISSVTISSNKPFLGSYNMISDAWTNSGNELNLNATSEPITVPANGEVSLWFITAPVSDATLSIYVVTDKHQYEKDFTKTISFAANTVTSFATTVANSEVIEQPGTNNYVRVDSNGGLTPGQYLLVSEYTGKVFTGISSTNTKYGIEAEVTISEHSITPEAASASGAQVLELVDATVTTGKYAFMLGEKYLTWTSGNSLNVASSESQNTNWTITISSGNATIANVADETRILLRNCASPRFACYAGQTPKDDESGYDFVQLYKLDEGGSTKSPLAKPVIVLSKTENLKGIIVTWSDVTKAANYTVACTGQTAKTIAPGVQTAEFSNLEPGTYTVTVTANPANTNRNTATTSDEASLEILNYNLPAPTVTFVAGEDNIVVNWTAVPNASSYTYTVLNGDTVVVEETNTESLTFTASGLTENTTYTFKIKSIGEDPFITSDFGVQTQKTLKAALGSIAEIKTELANGANTYEANVTNAIITGKYTASSTVYAYIQDATAGILIQGASSFEVGDSYTGRISGNMTTYKNQPELTSVDVSQATKTPGVTIPEPVVVTIAQLNADMASYDGSLCKIVKSKAAATLASGTNKSINIAQGENSIKLFTRASYEPNTVLKDGYYDVIGYPAKYDGTNEIVIIETGKITETPITWQLKSIDVATQPTKSIYSVGENFNPTGLVISTIVEDAADDSIFKDGDTIAYANNESDFSFNPSLSDALTVDNTSVLITYRGKSTSLSIIVRSNSGATPVDGTCFNLTSYSSVPEGWVFTNVDTGAYFKVNSGGSMESPAYNLTGCTDAIISIEVAKYGNGTNPAAILYVSYDGGATWEESKTLTAPTNSTYLSAQTTLTSTYTSNVVVKLVNPTGNAALRVKNFSLTVSN